MSLSISLSNSGYLYLAFSIFSISVFLSLPLYSTLCLSFPLSLSLPSFSPILSRTHLQTQHFTLYHYVMCTHLSLTHINAHTHFSPISYSLTLSLSHAHTLIHYLSLSHTHCLSESQHRQFLNCEGIGQGTPFQREKQ